MTSEQILASSIVRCDRAWDRVRSCLADADHLNIESKVFRDAADELRYAIDENFKFKCTVASAARLICDQQHSTGGDGR